MYQKTIILIIVISLCFFYCDQGTAVKPINEGIDSMEIIDILMQYGTNGAKFTVNTAVNFVPLTYDGLANDGAMTTASGTEYIIPGDNFQLLSIGLQLPMGFEIYNALNGASPDNIRIALKRQVRAGAVTPMEPWFLYMPFPNYEMNMGMFYSAFNSEARLNFTIQDTVNISMVNVPAALNGVTFRVPIFVKILHNFDLIP